jgi:hypothetical protein
LIWEIPDRCKLLTHLTAYQNTGCLARGYVCWKGDCE